MSPNQQPTRVPTGKFASPRTQAVDIDSLSEADLASLQKNDPFLYHSIPAVRKATLSIRDIDPSDIKSPESSASSGVVTRKSRLATESHYSVLMEEVLAEMKDDELFQLDASDFKEDVETLEEDMETLLNLLRFVRVPNAAK